MSLLGWCVTQTNVRNSLFLLCQKLGNVPVVEITQITTLTHNFVPAKCQTCPAFFPTTPGKYGKCRHSAPIDITSNGTAMWAKVKETDWCLDHPHNMYIKTFTQDR